jgi:predicted RNase H-like nuclease (RuvC/YqgF family)
MEETLSEVREAIDYLVQADAHRNPSKAWDCVDAARGVLVSLKLKLQSYNGITRDIASEEKIKEQIEDLKRNNERIQKRLDEETSGLKRALKQEILEIKKVLDGFSQRLYKLEQFRSSQQIFGPIDRYALNPGDDIGKP